jgi:hypothetical protein
MLHVVPATAALAPSRFSGATAIVSSRDADLLVVGRTLENRVVAQKLADYGVTPEQIRMRLASMSDEDVHQLATASQGLPSGGDGIGVIISLLVVVILVIVIMKLMNKEIVIR